MEAGVTPGILTSRLDEIQPVNGINALVLTQPPYDQVREYINHLKDWESGANTTPGGYKSCESYERHFSIQISLIEWIRLCRDLGFCDTDGIRLSMPSCKITQDALLIPAPQAFKVFIQFIHINTCHQSYGWSITWVNCHHFRGAISRPAMQPSHPSQQKSQYHNKPGICRLRGYLPWFRKNA